LLVTDLEKYGVPGKAIEILKREINTLWEPQEKAIEAGLFEGRSLIVVAPTSSGKTLIAELAALTIARRKMNVLYLVPLKALAEEKYEYLREKYEDLIKLAISTGDRTEHDSDLNEYETLIATYEKADALMRKNIGWFSDLGLVIVDEAQEIGGLTRGPDLEIMLTAIKQEIPDCQFLFLAASISNPEDFKGWLGESFEVVQSKFRPTKLLEGVYLRGRVEYNDGTYDHFETHSNYPRHAAIGLGVEIVSNGGQPLIYSATRFRTERMARDLLGRSDVFESVVNKKALWEAADELEKRLEEMGESTVLLLDCIRRGIGFHHSGLTVEERLFVEKLFRQRLLRIVVATTTLAEGLNFPASHIIFAHDWKGNHEALTLNEYKSIAGRAGRPRYYPIGKTILIATNRRMKERYQANYIIPSSAPVVSRLGEKESFRPQILSIITRFPKITKQGILDFLRKTFYGFLIGTGFSQIIGRIEMDLESLENDGFISISGENVAPTVFGLVTSQFRLNPTSSAIIRDGLKRLSKRTKITDFYIFHLICSTPDFSYALPRVSDYEEAFYAREFLQNTEEFLYTRTVNTASIKAAHILEDWVNEIPLLELTKNYGFYHGGISETMAGAASWLLGSFLSIAYSCDITLSDSYRSHIKELNKRVKYGVKEDKIDIIYLLDEAIGRARAKELVEAGYKDLSSITSVSIDELENIVRDRRIARFIKKKAMMAEEDKFLKSRAICLIGADELGIDKRIIRSLYDDPHDSFTDAVRQILTLMGIENELYQVTDESKPDIKIPIQQGVYVIECKSPTKRRPIRSAEAGQIMYKVLTVEEPVLGMSVIGRTEFDERAYPMAERGKFSLVTASVLQSLFFDVYTNNITKDEALSIIFKYGLVHYKSNYEYSSS